MTLTNLPPATMRPYSSLSVRVLRRTLLITWRSDLRILRHSSADSSADGDPLVKVSARDDNSGSVPCNGLRKSVDGRFVKRCVNVGRVNVESICIYNASSCVRSCASLSPSLLMATKYKGPSVVITNLAPPAVKPFSGSLALS